MTHTSTGYSAQRLALRLVTPAKKGDPGLNGEAGNDFFGAGYYSSTIGRWLGPDWTMKANDRVPYVKLDDPQRLNRYSLLSAAVFI